MTFTKTVNIYLVTFLSLSFLFLPLTTLRAATLTNGMDATEIIAGAGASTQDFTDGSYTTTQSTLSNVSDFYIDEDNDRMFFADTYNNRVLVYNLNSSHEPLDYNADIVLGQQDFVTKGTTTTSTGMWEPISLAYDADNDYLFVVDSDLDASGGNSRVLVFDADPGTLSTGDAAINVLGEPNFTSKDSVTISTSTLVYPWGIAFDNANDRLFVAERAPGSRVVVYDTSGGITNGMDARSVLGKSSLTDSDQPTPSATSTWGVYGLFHDSSNNRLFVGDGLNQRTLIYDVENVDSGEAAWRVLGRDNFTAARSSNSASASEFVTASAGPNNLAITDYTYDTANNRLFVSDYYGNRVLVFDFADGITNGESAINVIGQDDFVSSGVNQGSGYFNASRSSLAAPVGMSFLGDNLYIADAFNSRVLRFDLSVSSSGGSDSGLNYTHPPVCEAHFSNDVITKGESVFLHWSMSWPTHRKSVYYIKIPGEGLYSSKVNTISIKPQHTKTYRVAIFNLWGANFCEAAVTVLDENGEEVTSHKNSYLAAGVSNSSITRVITAFFSRLFVR